MKRSRTYRNKLRMWNQKCRTWSILPEEVAVTVNLHPSRNRTWTSTISWTRVPLHLTRRLVTGSTRSQNLQDKARNIKMIAWTWNKKLRKMHLFPFIMMTKLTKKSIDWFAVCFWKKCNETMKPSWAPCVRLECKRRTRWWDWSKKVPG